ncbi:MAG: O-sialoglycoprotein endopeptidase [Clostridiales bacterium]|jgi:N6-L-threonylcarbamoyladenine synthase|nr:O-sialoglycoprotein endopeptidase [Clostridiales bacterium]
MFFGLDTSCYTTSLAVIDDQGRLLGEERKLLEVPRGGRGLRQSEGVFQHLRNLPVLAEKLAEQLTDREIQAVAASVRPRPVAGSYMPVFTVGESFGRTLAAAAGVPFIPLSHQEAHLMAGIWSAGVDWRRFLAVHISGGTTDVLAVTMADTMSVQELGGSADLHVGQFIDRVGVSLGLPFPAGPALEALACQAGGDVLDVPVSVSALTASFSGPESHVQRAIERGTHSPAAVARGVERCVAESLRRLVNEARAVSGLQHTLFVGGVAANRYISSCLNEMFGENVAFADPRFAGDNAVGAALFAQRFYLF